MITPRVLKGFRDFLPGAEIVRRDLIERVEISFRSFGFVPIDTPALEYAEILLGKGGGETEKQVYRFTDQGGRDVALRFDLTVPFARFVAEHRGELTLPFRRYHIAKVWRGENTQRGRYREFTQCDADIVGSDSAGADAEILLLMAATLRGLGAGDVTIRMNHRGLFNLFLNRLGVAERSVEILRAVDKRAKAGRDEVTRTLTDIVGGDNAARVMEFIEVGEGDGGGDDGGFAATLAALTAAVGGPCPESERLARIHRILMEAGEGAAGARFVLDPSITRGLDYYTGIVYETFLTAMPEIGSVCSGGRYDNLTALYSAEAAPGVGASIGLDRLIAALETLGALPAAPGYARLGVARVGADGDGAAQALAGRFRRAGVACEVFLDEEKLPKQFMRAERKGIRWMVIPGGDGGDGGDIEKLTLRDLAARANREGLTVEEVVAAVTGPRPAR